MIPGIRSTLAGLILGAGGKAVHLADVATLAAAGSTQTNAAAITATVTKVTGADGTKGVRLPAPNQIGQVVVVYNAPGGGSLKVYPQSGATIGPNAANAAYGLAAGSTMVAIAVGLNEWAMVAV